MSEAKFTIIAPWEAKLADTISPVPMYWLVKPLLSVSTYNKADAHLIAAAPEMYEMLLAVNEWHIMRGGSGPFQTEIDKLLAKARGEA